MGIVEIEAASSAQLKGAKEIVAGIRGSEMGMGDDSENVTVGSSGGSVTVCVDIDATEDGGMIGGFVWMEMEEVVDGIVWVVTLILDTRAFSQRSCSSCVPAKKPSLKALSLDSCMRSAKLFRASENRSSYCVSSFSTHLSYPSLKARSHRTLIFSLSDDEVAVVRNELMVRKSASLTNVRNASSWQVEVTGDMRMSGVGRIGIETGMSVEMCAIRTGEAAVHHRDSNSCLTRCHRR